MIGSSAYVLYMLAVSYSVRPRDGGYIFNFTFCQGKFKPTFPAPQYSPLTISLQTTRGFLISGPKIFSKDSLIWQQRSLIASGELLPRLLCPYKWSTQLVVLFATTGHLVALTSLHSWAASWRLSTWCVHHPKNLSCKTSSPQYTAFVETLLSVTFFLSYLNSPLL